MPRDYRWWLSQKRRVQKKYTLFCGKYYSPKEVKAWFKVRKAYLQERRFKNDDL